MTKGISLHIGLNSVDPSAYDGWDGRLTGCVNDANDMAEICGRLGHRTQVLIDSAATAVGVMRAIGEAAADLEEGDLFVLSYSGHGSQVPDATGDEADRSDETWVLWDRMLIDDELQTLWTRFKRGVRIFLVSDSCHSGTVMRVTPAQFSVMRARAEDGRRSFCARAGVPGPARVSYRFAPPEVSLRVAYRDRNQIEARQWIAKSPGEDQVASLILISACQDDELAADGERNGLFTETLKRVWADGSFEGDYRSLWNRIRAQMPPTQRPNFEVTGPAIAFDAQRPFAIEVSAAPSPVEDPAVGEAPVPSSSAGARTLRRGDSGADVTRLQELLHRIGYSLSADGSFGPKTESCVRAFQDSAGLEPDGIVGPMTWERLEQEAAGRDRERSPFVASRAPAMPRSAAESRACAPMDPRRRQRALA